MRLSLLATALASTSTASLLSILDGLKAPDGYSLGSIFNNTAGSVESIGAVQKVVQGVVGSLKPSQEWHQEQGHGHGQDQKSPYSLEGVFKYVSHMADGGIFTLDVIKLIEGLSNSKINQPGAAADNSPEPPTPIYPSQPGDAPYSVSEKDLRDSIYIPDGFQFGANDTIPVLLVPGTAAAAGTTFYYSFAHLAKAVPNADVTWLNIPQLAFEDAQVNAEFVAYAVNYLSAVSGNRPLAIISWSQGGLLVQWALKYWPSIREHVSDFIPLSSDFHGTLLGNAFCPLLSPLLCDPSISQQAFDSNFAKALAKNDGDSAYVPTTSVYSLTDRFAQPKTGSDNATAMLQDARGVGVTNAILQEVCPGQPAGGIFTHEGILYSSVAWALAVDALTHDGPGDINRIDRDVVCAHFAAPELQLDDVLGCEAVFVMGIVSFITHPHKVINEPELKPYATSS